MILNMTSGGGGSASLNFKVVGGTSTPSGPRANTIWVNTSTTITDWVFSATQPTASEGRVWIQIGISSPVEFNALKKNSIQVYPISAKQYVGGAWVAKTAKSYQSGVWQDWIPAGALYFKGNTCNDTSGGWNARGWVWGGNITGEITPTITYNSDHMLINVGRGNLATGAVEVNKDQDLTNVSKLTIDFEASTYAYIIRLLVIPRSLGYLDEHIASTDLQPSGDAQTVARKTVSLDVSGVSGSYDVVIAFVNAWSDNCNATMKVYSVIKE